jgi:hypothetical protein
VNDAVRAAARLPGLELELDRFNLEFNSDPVPLAGRPLQAIGEDLERGLAEISRAAGTAGARVATVGILPTLRTMDLGAEAMSDSPRFRALRDGLMGLRGGQPFRIDIDGDEPLRMGWDDITLEGAATGLHVHLRVPPTAFASVFNAAQTAIGPVLAAAGNSPILLEQLLWHETRVAVFGQPFAESVALHVPILPVVSDEDPGKVVAAGGVPSLRELRLHHGTVWRWNRAVYQPGDDAHLRIEMRALPAGPSMTDMRANVAFLVGLTMALAPQMAWMARSMPFDYARRNFYAAAREGLGAVLLWPSPEAPSPRPAAAAELVGRLLPVARVGLTGFGVDPEEADALLDVVAERTASGQTGSVWQRRALAALGDGRSRPDALAAVMEAYLGRSAAGAPVHTWDVPG